jgi:hypothetical protein
VKASRAAKSTEDVSMEADREATIREQERLAREGSRLLDVVLVGPSLISASLTHYSWNETRLFPSEYRQYKSLEHDKPAHPFSNQ